MKAETDRILLLSSTLIQFQKPFRFCVQGFVYMKAGANSKSGGGSHLLFLKRAPLVEKALDPTVLHNSRHFPRSEFKNFFHFKK